MKFANEKLAQDVKDKREKLGLSYYGAGKQIGCCKATVFRIENSGFCDLVNFARILTWLGNEPNKYFE